MSLTCTKPKSRRRRSTGQAFPGPVGYPTIVLGLDAPVARGVVVRLEPLGSAALIVDPETVRSFWLMPPAGHALPKSLTPGSRGLFRLRRGRPEFEPAAKPRRMPEAETSGPIRSGTTPHALKQEIPA